MSEIVIPKHRFGLSYILEISTKNNGILTISDPMTCEFNIDLPNLSVLKNGTFKIYNLSPESRDLIYKEEFNILAKRKIDFYVGHSGSRILAFSGQIRSCMSSKNGGDTDVITEIDAYDGGLAFRGGVSNFTLGKGSTQADLLSGLVRTLDDVELGDSSDVSNSFSRGVVMFGSTKNAISGELEGDFFVDNGVAHFLKPQDVLTGYIAEINADTGLLGSPIRTDVKVEGTILFEPLLMAGQGINLVSTINPMLNGRYKLVGFTHSGTISGSVESSATTSFILWSGDKIFNTIAGR